MKKVSKSFGKQILFKEIDFHLGPGEKAVLIGDNGAGKSTLLKMIQGSESPETGIIERRKDITIGYLDQHALFNLEAKEKNYSLKEFLKTAFPEVLKAEKELERVENLMGVTEEENQLFNLIEKQQNLLDKLSQIGAYGVEGEIDKVLGELRFPPDLRSKQVSELIGGWLIKAIFARLILSKPDLMVLDEPTNHLDIVSLMWLEKKLREFSGTLFMVSHDRNFINALVRKVVHLEIGNLTVYNGNYEEFLEQYEQNRDILIRQKKRQDKKIEKATLTINRFRAKARKASMVQSMMKQIDKMERIEIQEEASAIRFRFPEPPPSHKYVLQMEGIKKNYGEHQILKGIDLLIQRGEKIALMGENGAGKTTLLKLIIGLIEPTSGVIKMGEKVLPGYFHQQVNEVLNGEKTLMENLESDCPPAMIGQLRNILGSFLFRDEDVFKKVAVLSGGEKNRLLLCRLLLKPNNFLILDEPTNHLDLTSKDILLDAIDRYQGTLLFVSHDRHFVASVATQILFLEEGHLTLYPGDFEYFNHKRELEEKSKESLNKEEKGKNNEIKKTSSPQKDSKMSGFEKTSPTPEKGETLGFKERKIQQKELKRLEKEIESLEKTRGVKAGQLAESYIPGSPFDSLQLTSELKNIDKNLEGLFKTWEKCQADSQ